MTTQDRRTRNGPPEAQRDDRTTAALLLNTRAAADGQRPRLLTATQAAILLTLKESTLRDYARRGVVPSVKLGRHLRFVESDLLDYLDDLRQRS